MSERERTLSLVSRSLKQVNNHHGGDDNDDDASAAAVACKMLYSQAKVRHP